MRVEKLQITDNFLALGMRRGGQRLYARLAVWAEESGRIGVAAHLMAPSISFTGTLNMAKGLTASGLAAALALASLAGASGHSVAGSLAGSANEVASEGEAPGLQGLKAGGKPRPSGG